MDVSSIRRDRYRITGQVQGVGFRPFVYRLARELGVSGHVLNDARGVTLEAEAAGPVLDELVRRILEDAPALARVDAVRLVERLAPQDESASFRIVASDGSPAERGRVTVDAALCEDCRRELFDPSDRRHRHGLINCTNCGPRYTIVRDLPYDRPATTMAAFGMCPRCAAEYADPADRRFHAQPICCPECGPVLRLLDATGAPVARDALAGAVATIARGGILALKGLGGYHLACDAARDDAVDALRRGKGRDSKPFALMVPHLDAARALVTLSAAGEQALRSPAAPIVIAARRDAPGLLAAGVAADHHRLGVMLPYTPMQHLLLEGLDRPLVMTSANASDDPLIVDDEEARRRLGHVARAFWVHDRAIERAVDDGIVLDAPRGPIAVRRARGHVPSPLPLPVAAPAPGLAVGGELKSTVAVVRGDAAVLSQHLGDLKWTLARERFATTIADLERLFDVRPAWLACDRHPDYVSTVAARRRARQEGLRLLTVQHHHAHLAAVLAEHGRPGPALGLVCDGVGWGDDGTAWGGEVLHGDLTGFDRLGHLRPLRLPGGDAAARQTGRPALAWLFDLLGPEAAAHPLAARVLPHAPTRRAVATMLERDVRCPPSSGLGRLFDAAAAVLGACLENEHEAMSGMRLEAWADRASVHPPGDDGARLEKRPDGNGFEIDTRPLLRTLLADEAEGLAPEARAWRFHDGVAASLALAARHARDATRLETVALSGGVFLNALLTDRLGLRLERDGFEVLLPREVPPGDGGIAYGQAAVAAAVLAREAGAVEGS